MKFNLNSAMNDINFLHENCERFCGDKNRFYNGKVSSGAYGSVYIPMIESYVIKRVNRFDDYGYTAYAKYCRRSYVNNRHLPQIYKIIVRGDFRYFIIEKLKHNIKAQMLEEKINDYFYKSYKTNPINWKKNNALKKVLNKIRKLSKTCGEIDIHYNNIMMRGKTFVITDPLC